MELEKLDGNIIGIINKEIKEDNFDDFKVKDIVTKRSVDALKMVGLTSNYLDKPYNDLSLKDKSKVILASKLQDKAIVLVNITKGMMKKDIDNLKRLLKKISTYNRKIILVDNNSYLFLDLVDTIYVYEKDIQVYVSHDLFDVNLAKYMQLPKLVEFITESYKRKVSINHYVEFDELLKAIYRIKS